MKIIFALISFFVFNAHADNSEVVSDRFMNYSWQDERERPFSFHKDAPQTFAVAIAYTKCNSICPMVSREILKVSQLLEKNEVHIPVYLVTIDPRRDSAKNRKAFLKKLKKSDSDWRFLRAQKDDTRELIKELKMGYTDIENIEHAAHTMTLAVIDRNKTIRSVVQLMPENTEAVAKKIQEALSPQK